jgi:hypothetical protein
MPNFFFVLILFFLGLPCYSQGDLEKEPLSSGGGRVIIRGGDTPVPPSSTQINNSEQAQPSIAVPKDNEDSSVAELESDRAKHYEKIKMVEKSVEPLKDPVLNPLEEIKKLGHKQLDFNALLDKRVIVILRDAFKDGLLGHLPEAEVKKIIVEKMKGTRLESVVEFFPGLLPFFVDLARDKYVFHSLLTLFERREDLKTYAYIWLAIFIFGLLVKNRLVKPKWSFFRRLRWNMTINLFLTLISFSVFYFMFTIEVDPILKVILKQF